MLIIILTSFKDMKNDSMQTYRVCNIPCFHSVRHLSPPNCERWPYCGVPPLSGQEIAIVYISIYGCQVTLCPESVAWRVVPAFVRLLCFERLAARCTAPEWSGYVQDVWTRIAWSCRLDPNKQPPVKMSDGEVGASGYYERACEGCEPQSRPGEGAKLQYTFWASREQILNGQFPLWTTCSGIDVAWVKNHCKTVADNGSPDQNYCKTIGTDGFPVKRLDERKSS